MWILFDVVEYWWCQDYSFNLKIIYTQAKGLYHSGNYSSQAVWQTGCTDSSIQVRAALLYT